MKRNYSLKVLLVSGIISLSSHTFAKVAVNTENSDNATQVITFDSEEALVQNALENIKKKLENIDGNAFRVSARYKLTDDCKAVNLQTKIHFSDYHKTPVCITSDLNSDDADRIIEIVYVPNKKHVALIDFDPETNKRIGSKKIKLSELSIL